LCVKLTIDLVNLFDLNPIYCFVKHWKEYEKSILKLTKDSNPIFVIGDPLIRLI